MFGIFRKTRSSPSAEDQTDSTGESSNSLSDWEVWKRHGPNAAALTDEVLRARLAETVAWCDSLGSLSDFRSRPLMPRLFHDGPDDLVCDLGLNRQVQLRHQHIQVTRQAAVAASGRFMLYFPDENLADGYSEQVSDGFFDGDNLPPCDTWVATFLDDGAPWISAQRQLLCYVPPAFIEAASAAIGGNVEECIVWLDQSTLSIRQRVEALTRAAHRTSIEELNP